MSSSFDDSAESHRVADVYRAPVLLWALGIAALLFAVLVAWEGFTLVVRAWLSRPEYSHGLLIPAISAFLIWQQRKWIGASEFTGSWPGLAVTLLGLLLWLAGKLSTIYTVSQYALVIMIYGIVLSLVGWNVFRKIWVPLLLLLLMIPLPEFLYANLSSELQLISSQLGVWFIRLFGISVNLSGNVIDLGHFQMQVVEACDGLRYLFPLMTLGFIVAYFFKAPLWQRLFVFASSIPITIVMNSLRIGMIGVFAEYGNTSLAEGLLHDLQGWVIFMCSSGLLLAETWALTLLLHRGRSWRELMSFAPGEPAGRPGPASPRRRVPGALLASVTALSLAIVISLGLPDRVEAAPTRSWFVNFPLEIGEWRGRQGRIEDVYLDTLKVTDYLMADFANGSDLVNLYSAYYDSQRQGASIHSPRSCLPGGGWRIAEFEQIDIAAGHGAGSALPVNRALIELGSSRQLVYYWFKQRDRVLTNEYAVKWYIFVDALTRGRTDGALVRVTTALPLGEPVEAADARLAGFARQAYAEMNAYVPD